jgi:hypothetical protein
MKIGRDLMGSCMNEVWEWLVCIQGWKSGFGGNQRQSKAVHASPLSIIILGL